MDLSQKPRQRADYRLETLDDELLLFHPSQTTIMYCNQTASLVWHLCDGQRSIAAMIDLLESAYPETPDLRADIIKTVQQFAAHQALEFI